MDTEVIQAFNKALVSMQETKGGMVSKQKVLEITKAAMNGVRYFKHVVFIIERYLAKCRQEFKMPALYVMDSILRQAKKQYKHKDVFAPRFATNLTNTIQNVLACDSADRLKVVRVVNLWQAHQVFTEDTLEPVLQQCRASGLEVDPARVEQLVKGDRADMALYQPQFAERGGLSFGSSGGSIGASIVGTALSKEMLPSIPIIPCEQQLQPSPRVVPPPPPGPPPPSTPGQNAAGGVLHHQQSLEERLSQFKKLSGGPLCTATGMMTPPASAVASLSRTNSVSGGTPSAIVSASQSFETGPKTPPLMEDQDHRFVTGQFTQQQQTVAALSVDDRSTNMGGLSCADVLQLLMNGGAVTAAVVPPDICARPDALANVQRLLNERVSDSLEMERRREGNIKNVLAREFDYSDEEDEAAAVSSQNQSMGPLGGVSRDRIVTIARALLCDPAFLQELQQQFVIRHHQQQMAPFQLPDFTMPPPNISGGAINGIGAMQQLPKLFMSPPPKIVGGGTTSLLPLPPGTSPSSSAFNMSTTAPPPSLMNMSSTNVVPSSSSAGNRDQSSPPSSSSGKRHHHHHYRERERGGDRDRDGGSGRHRSDRNNDRASDRTATISSSGGGRKRNREWSPSIGDDRDLRRSMSPPGIKRERNDGAGSARRNTNDRDKDKRGSSRRERGTGRHDEEERKRGDTRGDNKELDQQERERRRIGLPTKPKTDHVLISSRTLWFGRIPSAATESDIVDSVKDIGVPEKVSLVFGRGCAYATMPDRRLAFKILDRHRLDKSIRVQNKNVKVDWATIPYLKDNQQLMDMYWDLKQGYAQLPYSKLPDGNVDSLMDGAWLELDTLPAHLRDRYTNTDIKHAQQPQQNQSATNFFLSPTAAAAVAQQFMQQQQAAAAAPLVTVTVPTTLQQAAAVPSVATAAGLMPATMFTQAAAMAFAGNLLPFNFPPPNMPATPTHGGATGAHNQQLQQQHQSSGTQIVGQPQQGNTIASLCSTLMSTPPPSAAAVGGFANLGFANAAGGGGFGSAGGFSGATGGGGQQQSAGGRGGGQWTPRGGGGRGGARGGGGSGGFQPRFSSSGDTFRPRGGFQSYTGGFDGGRFARGGGRGGGRGWDGGANSMMGGRGGRGGARGGRGGSGFYGGGHQQSFGDQGGFGTGANREPFGGGGGGGFGALLPPPQSESEGNVPSAVPSNNNTGNTSPQKNNEFNAQSAVPLFSDSARFGSELPKMEAKFGQQQQQQHHCSETESDAPPGLD